MKARIPRPLRRDFVSLLEVRLHEPAPLIQVILGPRQVGKTTGVQMLRGFEDSLHYVSADETFQSGPEWITEQWQVAKLKTKKNPILVIDEIQKVLHWSEKIKALWDEEKRAKKIFKLVLLGSSSLSLSRGLEESLTGRFEVIPVYHWSFEECHRKFSFTFDDYLLYGGYPAAAQFRKDFHRWQTYLKNSIIETVIGKDILRQRSVTKPALFRQTFEILAAHPAQEISYNKILGQLQDRGNTDMVKHYIELFEGAFLFKSLSKFSGSVIRQKASSPKILPLCPALCAERATGSLTPDERGRIFEAAVGAELYKLPGKLYYWRENTQMEVDFIYVEGNQITAIEVKSGRSKSSRGLELFLKRYPKARPLFVTPDHFLEFSKDPGAFLAKLR